MLDTVDTAITSQQESIASRLEEIAASLSVLPDLVQRIDNLESKVDSLETLLVERANQLDSDVKECGMLRDKINEQTGCLDAKIVVFEDNLSAAVNSITESNNSTRSPLQSVDKNYTSPALSLNDNTELLVSSFVSAREFNLSKVAFTIFRAVLPTISMDDIVSCRVSISKEQQGSSASTSDSRSLPFFVRLRSSEIVAKILTAKRNFNLLHTRDLDLSLLDPADRQHVFRHENIY